MLTSSASPARGAVPPQKTIAGRDSAIKTVTLVTGDRVVLQPLDGPDRIVAVRPGKGRQGAQFAQRVEHGDTYVIPADAATLVASGRVDSRLFNVSKLVELGYDDSKSRTVPLMVTGQTAGLKARSLRSVGASAIEVSKADTSAFWANAKNGGKLWLDGPVRATLDRSAAQVGAPAAWQAGYKGQGAVVAVLDTGIDTKHPDLADAVLGEQDFTGSESGPTDRFGHGTHVAGIITGSGSEYIGVAPDAKLLNGKVLDDFGGGRESWIIAGMEWAAAQGVDVINMSLGSSLPSDGTSPMDLAVNRLTAETGVLFVVAAGNSGPSARSIGSPAAADAALTVGAVDRQDGLAEFSSRGPRWSNPAIKPDITAPGVDIVSAYADGALLGEYYAIVDGRYLQLSGTSMATPHVAAAAAILAARHTGWDADKLKPALMSTATPNPNLTPYEQGAGRLDLARAVTQPLHASPGSLSNGIARWPHHDDVPIVRDVTYHNAGPEPITLDVTVSVPNAPAGMFTVDQPRVTVPAGGTAVVKVTTDTRVPAADTTYTGSVNATGNGQASIRTPITVTREVESYDVTLNLIDRNGQSTSDYFIRFVHIAVQEAVVPYDASGRVVARVPKGKHYFETSITTRNENSPYGRDFTVIVEPELDVSRDLELTLDARQGRPTGVALDRPEAKSGDSLVQFARETLWGPTGVGYLGFGFDHFFVRPSDTAATVGTFTYRIGAQLARPDGNGGFVDSPYLYHVVSSVDGRVPTELVRRIRDSELARVETRIAAADPEERAAKDWMVDVATPGSLTEFYTPGLPWHPSVVLNFNPETFEFDGVLSSGPVVYEKAHRPKVERWNVGVFGPAFPDGGPDEPLVARYGDVMDVYLPMHADQPLNHQGDTRRGTTRMTLHRNGELVGEAPEYWADFAVPAEPARYRLEATTKRPATLSTTVGGVWTFASAQVPGEEPKPLPLMAVRYAPQLDDHNRAPGGRLFAFPVSVQQQRGSDHGSLRSLRVDLSYDDGQTWRRALVVGTGLKRHVILVHPGGAGFVSLRAVAEDSKGNMVEQTIIRAYGLSS
ncbi:S8 family peptidase [Allorhizocola rhizosphaerae]|uniref:S8 family peptidase n=1 Tax=Allorhizocola rhizosphaerae TaxID=1872709 RepID=UPI0013C2EAF6|nr:S8 family serine peptidase [Allorhizocola rhizosphaerae]